MKYDNEMKLTISAISTNESFARSVVAAFCVPINPTIEEIGDIKTAVSEAVTNSIVHGYRSSGEGNIDIYCMIVDNIVNIRIVDYGAGIPDVKKAMQPFFTSGNNEERSGMGFTVMQALMDEITVKSTVGNGTEVELIKRIATSKEEENA